MSIQNTQNLINDLNGKEASIESTEDHVQLVVFELDKEEYAVEITELQEIIEMPDITPVPNAPKFINGIFNLRGKIIVVVDLEKRFGLVRDNKLEYIGSIIITQVENNNYGVVVDKVSEIINISRASIQATPDLVSTKIHAEYLKGVVVISAKEDKSGIEKKTKEKEIDNNKIREEDKKTKSRLIILLDLIKMLQEKELLSFGKNIKETAKKASEK